MPYVRGLNPCLNLPRSLHNRFRECLPVARPLLAARDQTDMRPTCARRGEARQLQVLLGGSAAMLLLLAVSSYQSYQSAGGGSSGGSGSSAGGSGGGAAGAHGSRRELEAVVMSNVTQRDGGEVLRRLRQARCVGAARRPRPAPDRDALRIPRDRHRRESVKNKAGEVLFISRQSLVATARSSSPDHDGSPLSDLRDRPPQTGAAVPAGAAVQAPVDQVLQGMCTLCAPHPHGRC